MLRLRCCVCRWVFGSESFSSREVVSDVVLKLAVSMEPVKVSRVVVAATDSIDALEDSPKSADEEGRWSTVWE